VGYYGVQPWVDNARARGLDVTDLGGESATRAEVERTIQEKDPALFLAFGHGSETTLTGQDTIPVITACLNDGILAGRQVYLFSCLTGVTLGPSIISKGGVSYQGYVEPWTWLDEDGKGDPYVDRYARGFFEAAVTIGSVLIGGGNPAEARAACIAKHQEWIDYWSKSDDPNAAECVKWHTWDMEALTTLGSLTERPTTPTPLVAASPILIPVSLLVGAGLGCIPEKPRNKLIGFLGGTLGTFGIGLYLQKRQQTETLKAKKEASSSDKYELQAQD
jgi:hypothetical protein